jgi:hypothetical protein
MNTPSPVRRSPGRLPSPPRRTRQLINVNEYGTFFGNVQQLLNFNNTQTHGSAVHHPIVVRNVSMPNNRPRDPIGLRRNGKFLKGNYAVRVRQNGRNTYFKPKSFNGWFGKHWRSLPENSNKVISNKTHPLTRARVKRSNIKVVRFTS